MQHDVGYITYTNIIKKLEQYKKKSVIVNTVYIGTLRIFIDLRQKDFYQNKKNIIYKNSTSLLNIYKDIFLRSGTLQSESNPFILWMVGFEVYFFGMNGITSLSIVNGIIIQRIIYSTLLNVLIFVCLLV